MSITSLPAAVRRQVHERVGGCCEYCLLAEEDAFFPHEADHIIAAKHGSMFCPLFSAFGPEPIAARMAIGEGKVLITTESLYRRKVAGIRDTLSSLEHVLVVGEGDKPTAIPGTEDFHTLLSAASDEFTIPPTDPEDMAIKPGSMGRPIPGIEAAIVQRTPLGR